MAPRKKRVSTSRIAHVRTSLPNLPVEQAFDPFIAKNDRTIELHGGRMEISLKQLRLDPETLAADIQETLLHPSAVFQGAGDYEGDLLYFRKGVPGEVFHVRVQRRTWIAFVWERERANREDPNLPHDASSDRLGKRLK